jgi:2-methylisocitrate lyase-like PEP mutase family enzyme
VFNWVDGGKTPALGLERLRELGFSLVIYPVSTLLVASRAVGEALARLRKDGTPAALAVPAFDEFTGMIGLPELRDLEARFASG